ncbi:MAG: outer membrane protein assembly factor, partial [Pseudomonadota bacterium]
MRPSVRLTLATALALLTLAGQAAPASAFEIFGIRLFGGDQTPPSPDAIAYETEVTVVGESRALTRQLSGASRLVENSRDPSPSPAALLATARGDYQRLLSVLYSQGHYGGTISITVDGREAADMPIDATVPDGAQVDLTIDPGPTYLFGNVSIVDRPGPIADDRTVPKTPEELGLRPGEPAKSTVVLASEDALVARWRQNGYPKAKIAERTATARHPDDELDVYMRAAPGRP